MLQRVALATPPTNISLVSPFSFVSFGEQPSSQAKSQQSLVIWSQSSKGTPGSKDINLPKAMELSTMLNLRSNNLVPRPCEPHLNFCKIALMDREAAKCIMNQTHPIHMEPNMLKTT
jgi:hypothetical protein